MLVTNTHAPPRRLIVEMLNMVCMSMMYCVCGTVIHTHM